MSDGLYKIGSLEKALRLLEEIAESPGRNLADISRSLGAPRAGVFRHLKALEALGYVATSNDSKRYVLGPRLIYLGIAARTQMKLADIAHPVMVALRDEFNETVNLGVLARGEVIHVEVVPSTHPVKMAVQVGEWTYCHCSGLGKVLLAWSEPDVVSEAVRERGLPALTDRTVRTTSELAAALEVVRSAGFAIDDEESAIGLRCVAAGIRDATGKVVAGISLSSPADRLARDGALSLAPRIISAAAAISLRLGWFGEGAERGQAAQLTQIGR